MKVGAVRKAGRGVLACLVMRVGLGVGKWLATGQRLAGTPVKKGVVFPFACNKKHNSTKMSGFSVSLRWA